MTDVAVMAIHAPGPQPEHLGFLVGDPAAPSWVISGDLDGQRGARSIVGPTDEAATVKSRDRLRVLARGAPWLGGHPTSG